MRRRIMQAKACAHQRAKSCEATLCSIQAERLHRTSSGTDRRTGKREKQNAKHGNGTEVWEKGIQVDLPDGEYEIEVQLTGGSGRASVTSPAILQVQDEKAVIEIEWSSPNYDYMTMDGETYLPVNTEGNSVFELPVTAFDKEVPVTADTTAMSVPHEIEYTILLDSASIANAGKKPMEVIAVVYVAAVIAVSITAWQIHRKRKGKKE